MKISPDQAVFRIRRFAGSGDKPARYRASYQLSDDHTGRVMAQCDRVEHVLFATLDITDDRQRTWRLKPNRKILPTVWTITDPERKIVVRFDRTTLLLLLNPFRKVALRLRDENKKEVFRVVNPDGMLARFFSPAPTEWHLMQGTRTVAVAGPLAVTQPDGQAA